MGKIKKQKYAGIYAGKGFRTALKMEVSKAGLILHRLSLNPLQE